MGEVADFLYKCTPLLLGVLAFFIAPAAERLKKNKRDVDVVQGQPVNLTDYRVEALENDLLQEREIWRLKNLLTKHGIDYDETKDMNDGKPEQPGN